MTIEDKWTKLTIDRETLSKLSVLASAGYRTVPAEIRYLVDRELGQQELAEARRIVAGEAQACEEAK